MTETTAITDAEIIIEIITRMTRTSHFSRSDRTISARRAISPRVRWSGAKPNKQRTY